MRSLACRYDMAMATSSAALMMSDMHGAAPTSPPSRNQPLHTASYTHTKSLQHSHTQTKRAPTEGCHAQDSQATLRSDQPFTEL